MSWAKNVAIAVDQLVNALCSGEPDETLSARAWRLHRAGACSWPCRLVDTLFFFDCDRVRGAKHCELSYESEQLRLQLPPEYRK